MISKGEVITHGYKITLTHKKTGEVFIVYPDGRSETYPFGTPVTTGGMRGLILYLESKDNQGPVIIDFNSTNPF